MKKLAALLVVLFALPLLAQNRDFAISLDAGKGSIHDLSTVEMGTTFRIEAQSGVWVAFLTEPQLHKLMDYRPSQALSLRGQCIYPNVVEMNVSCGDDSRVFLVIIDSRQPASQAKDALAALLTKNRASAERLTAPNVVKVHFVE